MVQWESLLTTSSFEHMNFGPTVSHVQLGYIMWTGHQMRLGRSLKQSISLSSTKITRASPNSTSQVSATRQLIVLGHTWLAEHNPDINWRTGEVKLTQCPNYCGQAKSGSSGLDSNILVHPVKVTSETSERIHATTTIST